MKVKQLKDVLALATDDFEIRFVIRDTGGMEVLRVTNQQDLFPEVKAPMLYITIGKSAETLQAEREKTFNYQVERAKAEKERAKRKKAVEDIKNEAE